MIAQRSELISDQFVRIDKNYDKFESLAEHLRELWRHRSLITLFTGRSLRLRYKGSALGILWSLILPVVQVTILTIVFGRVMGNGPRNLSAYIFCAFIPWLFFSNAVADSSSSVLEIQALLKKIYFPREIMPISVVFSNFVNLVASLVIFLFYRYLFTTILHGWPGTPPLSLFWLPLILFDLLILTLGFSFLFCALTTFYEDVKYYVSVSLQMLFYALPILFWAENINYWGGVPTAKHSLIYHVYLANPLGWLIEAFKQAFFGIQVISRPGDPILMSAPIDWRYALLNTATSLTILIVGYWYFNKTKWQFAERP